MPLILFSSLLTTLAVGFAADRIPVVSLSLFFLSSMIFLMLFRKNRSSAIMVLFLIVAVFNPRIVYTRFSVFFHFIFILNLFFYRLFSGEIDRACFKNSIPVIILLIPFLLRIDLFHLDSQNIRTISSLIFLYISFLAFYNCVREKDLHFLIYLLVFFSILEFSAFMTGYWEYFKNITFSRAWINYYKTGVRIPVYLSFQNPNLFAAVCSISLLILLPFRIAMKYTMAIILSLLVLSTFSKGSILVLGLTCALYFLPLHDRIKASFVMIFSLLAFTLTVMSPLFLPKTINQSMIKDLNNYYTEKWTSKYKKHIRNAVLEITTSLFSTNNGFLIPSFTTLYLCSKDLADIKAKVDNYVSLSFEQSHQGISALYSIGIRDKSLLGRFFLIEKAVTRLYKQPLTGAGSGNFRESAVPLCTNESDCFISPLFWAAETGIFGVFLYFLACWMILKISIRTKWFYPVIFIFAYALIENIFFNILINWYIGLVFSFILLDEDTGPCGNP